MASTAALVALSGIAGLPPAGRGGHRGVDRVCERRGAADAPDGQGDPAEASLAGTIGRLWRALRGVARVADPGDHLSVAQLELLASVTGHPGVRPGGGPAAQPAAQYGATVVNALVANGRYE